MVIRQMSQRYTIGEKYQKLKGRSLIKLSTILELYWLNTLKQIKIDLMDIKKLPGSKAEEGDREVEMSCFSMM